MNEFEKSLLQSPSLPTPPPIAQRLLELLARDADMTEIAEVIRVDAALSARLIALVNSPMYGLAREVRSLPEALIYLGGNSVRSIALSFCFVRGMRSGGTRSDPGIDRLWRSSLLTALAARRLAAACGGWDPEEAFLAGLICDAGALVLYDLVPEYRAVLERFAAGPSDLDELESEGMLPSGHARIGSLLLQSWNFPDDLSTLVATHHESGSQSLRTRILHAAWFCARTFVVEGFAREAKDLRGWLCDELDLTADVADALLEELPEEFQTMADALEIPAGQLSSYAELLVRANEELRRLALQAEHRFRELAGGTPPGRSGFADLRASLAGAIQCEPHTRLLDAAGFEQLLDTYQPRARRRRTPLGLLLIGFCDGPEDGEPKPDPDRLDRLFARLEPLLREEDEPARLGDCLAILVLDCEGEDLLAIARRLRRLARGPAGAEAGAPTTADPAEDFAIAIGAATLSPDSLAAAGHVIVQGREALAEARESAEGIAIAG